MAEVTKIQWTHHTFNPWIGCTKVAPGCANCYAEADMDKRRHFALWGPSGTRVRTSDANWNQPIKWNREAAAAGERRRVFCASLADVFEDWQGPVVSATLPERKAKCEHCGTAGAVTIPARDGQRFAYNAHTKTIRATGRDFDKAPLAGWRWATLNDVRRELFALIDATPNLDWLLLTKRPENIRNFWHNHVDTFDQDEADIEHTIYRPNIWLGTSISDQATADKAVPELLRCRDLSPVLFLSAEPLLGPMNLHRLQDDGRFATAGIDGVDWVIVGGESGPNCRPCRPEWIRAILGQCQSAAVPCFVKQMGGNVVTRNDMVEDQFNSLDTGWPDPDVEHDIHGFREDYQGADCRIRLRDKKGGDMSKWPENLRVREFPVVAK